MDSGVLFHSLQRKNNQFSTPWKENVHRHSLQSFALIPIEIFC